MAWVDDEPAFACFVLSDAEGRGVVDERRAETADKVARYQADYIAGRLCYSYHKLPPRPRGCFVPWFACYFPMVLSLALFTTINSGVFFFFFFSSARCFHVSATSLAGEHDGARFFSYFFLSFSFPICLFCFRFSLFSFCVSLFHRMCMSCLSHPGIL